MRTIVLALVACLTAATLPAAEPPPVSVGSRIRAYASGTVVHGTLLAYGPEGLTIETRQGRDATTLGLERIERLQVAHGRRWLAGLFYGALIGSIAGLVAGLVEANHVARNGDCELCGLAVPAYFVLGIPVGALVGTAVAPPAWHDVSLPPLPEARKQGLGFRVLPVRGGAGIALTYAF
jgi:hypothetical protein